MDDNAFRTASIFTDETVPIGDGTLEWLPLRRRLGIRGFGTNAYRAPRAGDRVVEDHVESPGQEEMYVVIRGAARFEVDGVRHDAGAGEVVHVPDPKVRRGAIATEDGTVVLGVGGWPDAAYRLLPWEPIYLAQPYMRAGDWQTAAEVLEREAGEILDHPFVRYRLACCQAQAGDLPAALESARRALASKPDLIERLENDELLGPLRAHPGWASLEPAGG